LSKSKRPSELKLSDKEIKPSKPSPKKTFKALAMYSPLTDEEFFDAIDEQTGIFDEIEVSHQHNENLKKEVLKESLDKEDHRYAHQVTRHLEKHAKSLDTTLDGDSGWIEFHKEGEMILYRRDETTPDGRIIDPLRLFHRIEGVTSYECQHYFWDTKYRLDWEHTIESFKILEFVDPQTFIIHQKHKRVWPAAKRDALYLSNLQKYEAFKTEDPCYLDTWITTNFSVTHSEIPEISKNDTNNVRVFIDVCMISQTFKLNADLPATRDNIYTKLIYISQVDPGGWLPPAALRSVFKKEYPRFLRKFTKYVLGKTKATSPKFNL